MKKALLAFIVLVFIAGSVNAQGSRDDDSYYIYFDWGVNRTIQDMPQPGGYFLYDFDLNQLMMSAVRTYRAFNVYAKNNSPGIETDNIMDHSAWPNWYIKYGWDTPDADSTWSNGTRYLISLDTVQKKWWLFYVEYPYPGQGTKYLSVPLSGKTKKVEYNEEDNTVEIELEEDHGDWGCFWIWGIEVFKLQDKHFIMHLDLDTETGWIAPKQIAKPKKPKK